MMPTMAKQRINLGEFAEEATIVVEDAVKTRAAVNFLGSQYGSNYYRRTCNQVCCAYLG